MGFIELFLIALGLAMDAFAVSIGKGLCTKTLKAKHYWSVGTWFGGFQALMPVIGFMAGVSFTAYVTEFDHWIAFALLCFIGGNMIKDSFTTNDDTNNKGADFGYKTMLLMAIATSIDALAVGVSFAFMRVDIVSSAAVIGIVSFVLSAIGLKIGNVFGSRYMHKAEFAGGLILVLIGTKILIEHLCEE